MPLECKSLWCVDSGDNGEGWQGASRVDRMYKMLCSMCGQQRRKRSERAVNSEGRNEVYRASCPNDREGSGQSVSLTGRSRQFADSSAQNKDAVRRQLRTREEINAERREVRKGRVRKGRWLQRCLRGLLLLWEDCEASYGTAAPCCRRGGRPTLG